MKYGWKVSSSDTYSTEKMKVRAKLLLVETVIVIAVVIVVV